MQSVEITEVVVPVPGGDIGADLATPANPLGLVVLPQSASSGRAAARNDGVAHVLHDHGLATLTVHLLLPVEAAQQLQRADAGPEAGVLCDRLQRACRRARTLGRARPLPVVLCGVGADAALALWGAALEFDAVRAVATLGGRPDLVSGDVLARVDAPTLLVVGNLDPFVAEAARTAARRLRPPNHVALVPGATHAFAAPGQTEDAARLAALWFRRHLGVLTHRPPIGEEACVE